MASSSVLGNLPPSLLLRRAQPLLRNGVTFQVIPLKGIVDWRSRAAVLVKATSESSESSASLSVVKSVQNVWEKPEDRVALIGLGVAGVIAFWASVNLIMAIDKLPVIPSFLELVGILYSAWFVYRYLLFKPDREELFQIINKSISNIIGQ